MYNAKCPICNSEAYQGFASVECSNVACKNFKKQSSPNQASTWIVTAMQTQTGPHWKTIEPTRSNTNEKFWRDLRDFWTELNKTMNSPVIAGGFARDVLLNKDISQSGDIDFFVQTFSENDLPAGVSVKKQGSARLLTQTYPDDIEVYQLDQKITLGSIAKEIQIIKVKNIYDHISKFDFGINMISIPRPPIFVCSPIGREEIKLEFFITSEFFKDLNEKKLTF